MVEQAFRETSIGEIVHDAGPSKPLCNVTAKPKALHK